MKRRNLLMLGIGLIVALFVVDTLAGAGTFRSLELREPAELELVEGLPGGSEDARFAPDGRHVFVSSPNFHEGSKPGALLVLDVETGKVRDVTPESFRAPGALQPHGIDLWIEGDETRLFVVNHPGGSAIPGLLDDGSGARHTVEIFDVKGDFTLEHLESVEDPAIRTPNDVAASGLRTFYVTNDHGFQSGLMRKFEEFARLSVGNIVYFDGEKGREVYGGTRYANGIALSRDRKSLYVAETTGRMLYWFDRDEKGDLALVSSHDAGTGLDNIDVAPDGSLFIGAHPKLLAFVAHSTDPSTKRSPSEVIRVVPERSAAWTQETVYLNDGDPISGSSVAATNGEIVVVGAVFDHKVVYWSL